MSKTRETYFQQDIVNDLLAQGWLEGKSKHYDREAALYTEDVLGYYQEAWPHLWEAFAKKHPHNPEQTLIQQTVRALKKQGTLNVLRHGFKVLGTQVNLCSFKPDHSMNPEAAERYTQNRLRVVQEVSYSPHSVEGTYNPRIDLVLFVNGIPVATLELKSGFKQSIDDAKNQYKNDRPPRAKTTNQNEPLLTFKRGALVHFAVTQSEVAMTTRLAGASTFFLPFNLGTSDGGAGNPQASSPDAYTTEYLWKVIFAKDNWLKIIGRFLHLEVTEKEDENGILTKKETMIFPRFHQWDVVTKLVADTDQNGAGKRYLIQHSAGSGKSNSIAWAAHQLAQLYTPSGDKLFSSIIVITDRTVLDNQLQETIYQFEHAQGVVCRISDKETSKSKSQQLKEALESNARIIIVTIQTFPALYELLGKDKDLVKGNYAVIADEAHSSQTGSAAGKLRSILGTDVADDAEGLSSEDLLEAAVRSRGPSAKISYYAFTATPKAKTLELFGQPPNPDEPVSDDNKPEAFHLYSMRQAIEEGFILDVLKNYTTYSMAYKLAHPNADLEEVDPKRAQTELAKWVRMHPHNISQKVEVIVEHFRSKVVPLLNGQAKAMVVTDSRKEAVRFQLAMRHYIAEKGYRDIEPLVAFSGSIAADEDIPQEVTEHSEFLNKELNRRDLAKAFDTQDYNVMIVANKYQTGFDQPKLCAMYVNKKLASVACVQTLSRLNRLYPGKETFILDFVNDPQEIVDAFMPYYNKAELNGITDPQIIYDLQQVLDEEQIYHQSEVDALSEAFFNTSTKQSALIYHCEPAHDRFMKRFKALSEQKGTLEAQKRAAQGEGNTDAAKRLDQQIKAVGESIDQLYLFRKNLSTFVRTYEFLSQINDYGDTDLEKLSMFAKLLAPLLRIEADKKDIVDLSELELTHYRLRKQREQQLRLDDEEGKYGLDPATDVGTAAPHDPEAVLLQELIEKLNDLHGSDVHSDDQVRFLDEQADRAMRVETAVEQVGNNTEDQAMLGVLPKIIQDNLLDSMNDHSKMVEMIFSSPEYQDAFNRAVYQVVARRIREKSVGSSNDF